MEFHVTLGLHRVYDHLEGALELKVDLGGKRGSQGGGLSQPKGTHHTTGERSTSPAHPMLSQEQLQWSF